MTLAAGVGPAFLIRIVADGRARISLRHHRACIANAQQIGHGADGISGRR